MLSMSLRQSSASSTGVLPVFTTCFGPRTAAAGFIGITWPVMSQSNSIRTAASCCFTPSAPYSSRSYLRRFQSSTSATSRIAAEHRITKALCAGAAMSLDLPIQHGIGVIPPVSWRSFRCVTLRLVANLPKRAELPVRPKIVAQLGWGDCMSSAAGQFSPLVEDRDDDAAVTIDKGETQKYLSFIKQAFKTGASNAVSTALGALGVPNPGMFTSLYSAYSSARHAARLKELYEHAGYPCSCGRCEDALDFAIAQKQGKTASKAGDVVLGFVPHGGTAKSAVSALWDKFKT